jgi:hypothetical protein
MGALERGPEHDAAFAEVPASFGVRDVPVLQSAGSVQRSDDGDRTPEELTWENTQKRGLRELLLEVRELGLLRLGAPVEEVLVENMWTGRARTMRWAAESWPPVEEHGRSLYRTLRNVADTGDGMALLWDALQPDRDDAAYVRRFGRMLAGLQDGDALSPLAALAVQGAATGAGVPVPGAALLGRLVARLLWHHGDHDAITRGRLTEAVSVADLALCAHHGVLAESPGLWLLAKSRTDVQVTARLRRYLS